MRTSTVEARTPAARHVVVSEDALSAELSDGRTISVSLDVRDIVA